ncbi:MAG: NTPase [Thermogemmatispora sp.]|uniref:NTPase n=1 Tax=Thermogemmatispora sp. TaxID=1968838 RepID=UPI0019FCB520|nr:NTPase [Thermogemmatispora sp.]MBE3564410.1 NTPase [Thermogemmatispora sp.]
MGEVYLLTGEPGSGKTTAIKKVVAALGPEHCGGFYTEEVRVCGQRTGFEIVTLDGQRGLLASASHSGPPRVGRYGVDLTALESLGLAAIQNALQTRPVVIIDEIGPMELLSPAFRQAVSAVLESSRILVGTIVLRPYPWADELKRRPAIHLLELTTTNRDRLTEELVTFLLQKLREQGMLKRGEEQAGREGGEDSQRGIQSFRSAAEGEGYGDGPSDSDRQLSTGQ